jgi:UDP-N-acetylmuramyl tripeptide synthase
VLESIDGDATFVIDEKRVSTPLKLDGVYNIFNAAAAIALVRTIMGNKLNQKALVERLAHVQPAFGRGEKLIVDGQSCELVLVKNPAGFRLGLHSFAPAGYATMIAINDNYADGRDMSWLWDVDFTSLKEWGVAEVSGVRAYDMALRLQYDDVAVAHVDVDISRALNGFLNHNKSKPKRIYCTYTAMLAIRRKLAKKTTVEDIS